MDDIPAASSLGSTNAVAYRNGTLIVSAPGLHPINVIALGLQARRLRWKMDSEEPRMSTVRFSAWQAEATEGEIAPLTPTLQRLKF